MAVIGIDSHKDVLAGCLIDEACRPLEHRSISNTPAGHGELASWAQGARVERVAIEGSGNYGRPAAVALLAAGVEVVEVPPQMTAQARRHQRSNTKTDRVDALLVARIGARDDDLPPTRGDGPLDELRCLVGYRRELVQSRTGHVNRLHGDLEKIRCGYHRTISAITSDKALTRVMRLLCGDTGARANVARGRVRHIRELNRQIAELTSQIGALVAASGTTLTEIHGIGALTAADILAEVGDPRRFATKAKFAMANGTAPQKPAADASSATASTAAATANSTAPSTPPPSPRSPAETAKADSSTNTTSTAAKPNEKPSEPSNGASQTASGPTSSTTPPSPNSPHP